MKRKIKVIALSLISFTIITYGCRKKELPPAPDEIPAHTTIKSWITEIGDGDYFYYEISSGSGNDITYWAGDTVIFHRDYINGKFKWYTTHKLNYSSTPFQCSAFNYDTSYFRLNPTDTTSYGKSTPIENGNITFNQFFFGAGNWSDSAYSKSILAGFSSEFNPDYWFSGDIMGPHVPTIPAWMASYYEGTKNITNVSCAEYNAGSSSINSLPVSLIVRNNHANYLIDETILMGRYFITDIEYFHPQYGITVKKAYKVYTRGDEKPMDNGLVNCTDFYLESGGYLPILLTEVKPMYLGDGEYKRVLKSRGSVKPGQ